MSSDQYSYIEMTKIIEESGYLNPMVSSLELMEDSGNIVIGIFDDGILSESFTDTYVKQVKSITFIVGLIFLINLIFFFFEQREEIFVRNLQGNKLSTIFKEIILKELIIISIIFFSIITIMALIIVFPLRPISFKFLTYLVDFIKTFITIILVLIIVLYMFTYYSSRRLHIKFDDISKEFSFLNIVLKMWVIFLFIMPISTHITEIKQAKDNLGGRPLLDKVKDSYSLVLTYIVGYGENYDSAMVFDKLNQYGFDAILKQELLLSFEKNMKITDENVDFYIMNRNRFEKLNLGLDIDDIRNTIIIPQALSKSFNIDQAVSNFSNDYDTLYYEEANLMTLTNEESVNSMYKIKRGKEPIIFIANSLDFGIKLTHFEYIISNKSNQEISVIENDLKQLHPLIINSVHSMMQDDITQSIETIKFETPYLLILLSAIFLLTFQIVISSYYALRDLFANEILFGIPFYKRYWFYYVSILVIYTSVYYILAYKEPSLFVFYKKQWLQNLSIFCAIDLLITTGVLRTLDKKSTLRTLNEMT